MNQRGGRANHAYNAAQSSWRVQQVAALRSRAHSSRKNHGSRHSRADHRGQRKHPIHRRRRAHGAALQGAPPPAHLAQTARTRNDGTCQRVVADLNNERLALGFAPDTLHHALEDGGFDDGQHDLIVTPNNYLAHADFSTQIGKDTDPPIGCTDKRKFMALRIAHKVEQERWCKRLSGHRQAGRRMHQGSWRHAICQNRFLDPLGALGRSSAQQTIKRTRHPAPALVEHMRINHRR